MALSPMMEKYLETKKEYPDCILFYRLGDFYELFFEDAALASKELGLTLTGKDCGLEERAPMCGVPFHAVDSYLTKLVENGHKVAIAEQMEDPRFAKGLVKREVIRVVTPGTLTDMSAIDETKNRYIMSAVYDKGRFGFAAADVTTGEFYVSEAETGEDLKNEIFRFSPSEMIINDLFEVSGVNLKPLQDRLNFSFSVPDRSLFREDKAAETLCRHFQTASPEGLGLSGKTSGLIAAGALLSYLYDTQKNDLRHISRLNVLQDKTFMALDVQTRRNLELTETLREKEKKGTLLWVLDKTKTAMGARMLRKYTNEPLLVKKEIEKRQEAVKELLEDPILRDEIREYLNPIYDLERLLCKISYKTANPKDLIAFRNSIEMIPHIRTLLKSAKSELLREITEEMDEMRDLYGLIFDAIEEDPPVLVHDGNIIKTGFNELVDNYRKSRTEGKSWLLALETEEREKTGIKTLKVKFNKVFGYSIEVTNSFLDQVPDYFIRKQTLTGGERFITPRLKELEDLILGAEDKLNALEFELFKTVRDTIDAEADRAVKTAAAVATLDAIASLAYVAEKNRYVCPKLNEKGRIVIKNGRHPVIELLSGSETFVPNDTLLDNDENRVLIITGPNMAGKSTYMRQVALITLMAQMGSFVPADEADISISDRIFTRVGASDDLASGRSTFMVEMTEVSNILRNATKKSLIILDEIGRGTSTFDGLSIAWAVVEHIADPKILGAKTVFATHYHELTELEGAVPGVQNYCISVKEQGDGIVFLRKIVKGSADKSYGIQVARLAGVPREVLERAKELMLELVNSDIASKAREIAEFASGKTVSKKRVERQDSVDANQLTFGDVVKDDDVIREIRELDLTRMTPMDALNTLFRLQSEITNRF